MAAEEEAMTIGYYNKNASHFISSTVNAELSRQLTWFLNKLPQGACVLGWGCGSGRDAKSMIDAGYIVTASDASVAMCASASKLTGLDVLNESFTELKPENVFDGIWANASLLHVPLMDLPDIFEIAARALKPGGVFYASFKLGDFEGIRNGRWFTFMNESRLDRIMEKVASLRLIEVILTEDARKEREGEFWFNCLMAKRNRY